MRIFSILYLSALILVGCGKERDTQESSPAGTSDKPLAPTFSLEVLDGYTVTSESLKGKVVILDFWATWCPPCRAEVPSFVELYERYKDKGLRIVGVALDSEDRVREFIRRFGVDYPVGVDRGGEIARKFGGVRGIPTTFVLDKEGRVYRKYVGYREKSVFERDIKKLLEE